MSKFSIGIVINDSASTEYAKCSEGNFLSLILNLTLPEVFEVQLICYQIEINSTSFP